MLLYEEKKFSLEELIDYLNNLEQKSIVLDLMFGEKPVIVSYNIDDNKVDNIIIVEEKNTTMRFPENDYIDSYLTYENILEQVFTVKICGWKEISYLELIDIILNEPTEIAFQITEKNDNIDEELFLIENIENFKEVIKELILYDDYELVFFEKII